MTDAACRRLMLVELNEFAVELLRRGADELQLGNLRRLLAMDASRTSTEDQVEHRGLDPWVQWVSVHTGVPSSTHGILHLGDTPGNLGFRQVWEVLGEMGVSSGVWGAMNATRADAAQCVFFLPDPWTFSERAYPEELNGLLELPRYYSTNYLDVSKGRFLAGCWSLLKFLVGSGALPGIARQAPTALAAMLRSGINNALLFSLFDLFSTVSFLRYRRRFRPQFSLVFLNSIAHLQHHKWTPGQKLAPDLRTGLIVIDRVLGLLFADLQPGEAVIVMNALTQRNIAGEKPRICYRQINPARFLRAVGFEFDSVEQLMTNDAHVFFADTGARDRAAAALAAARIEGKPLFQVESNARDPRRLFYQVDFWDELEGDARVSVNGREISFLEHFEAIVARTGAHVREGDAMAEGIDLPATMANHELQACVLDYFAPAAVAVAGPTMPRAGLGAAVRGQAMNMLRLLQVLLSVAGISAGQLLLKLAAVNMDNARVPGISIAGYVVNLYLVAGVAVLGVSTLVWVWVLRSVPLGIAYPFMALAFIIVPALSYFVLGEPFGWKSVVGALLIVSGVVVIST